MANAYRGYLSRARVYRRAFEQVPQALLNYREMEVPWGSLSDYCVQRKVGRGRYGEVFEGFHVLSGRRCTVKVLKPVKLKYKFQREIAVLQALHGGRNLPNLIDVVRDRGSEAAALVFEWREADRLRDMVLSSSDLEMRHYMRELLVALDTAHSRGVMHRDIKPNNFLVDLRAKQLTLIDWGLGDFYVPGAAYNCRVATKTFKAPELLVGLRHYDYSQDMWSFGVTMASLIFLRMPFFGRRKPDSEVDPLVYHARVLGTPSLNRYLNKYKLRLTPEQSSQIKPCKRLNWGVLVTDANRRLLSEEAVDLCSRLLRFDHMKRLTAQEALAHPYFDPVRGLTAEDLVRRAERERRQ